MTEIQPTHKVNWISRLSYRIDQQFSAHPSVLILWLGALSILVVFLVGVVLFLTNLTPAANNNLPEALWDGFLHTIAGDSLPPIESPWNYRFLMLGVMLFNLFFVSIVIGALTSGMQTRLDELKRGQTRIIETNHTVILGWSERIFTILSELVRAHAEQPKYCIVVLGPLEKTLMEDEIRHKVGKTGRVRIVCRRGSPLEMHNLDLLSVNTSRNIIVLLPESTNPDAEVIKVVLAILNHPNRRAQPYQIIATVGDPKNAEIARVLGKNEVEWIQQGDVIARMIAQTALQPGLSAVYTDLFDYSDSEIYLHSEPLLVGRTFGETLLAAEQVCVIGLSRSGEKPVLSPEFDTVIRPGDELIVIAQDDNNIIFGQHYQPVIFPESIDTATQQIHHLEHTLVLGWNLHGSQILREMDRYLLPGSTVRVVADPLITEINTLEGCSNLSNLEITCQPGDTSNRQELDSLDLEQYQHVVLLSYSDKLGNQEADARTLITLLHLRDIADLSGLRFSIVTEMLDLRNRKLATSARPDDFIISDRMISLLIAQVSETRGICTIYDDLFNPEGAELYLRPAHLYIKPGDKINFYTLAESARWKNEIAIGYRLVDRSRQNGSTDKTWLNPPKSAEFVLQPDDQVVVLAKS
jgi:K+/H+ antiporter YhaU regulatory subunit KhtT